MGLQWLAYDQLGSHSSQSKTHAVMQHHALAQAQAEGHGVVLHDCMAPMSTGSVTSSQESGAFQEQLKLTLCTGIMASSSPDTVTV